MEEIYKAIMSRFPEIGVKAKKEISPAMQGFVDAFTSDVINAIQKKYA